MAKGSRKWAFLLPVSGALNAATQLFLLLYISRTYPLGNLETWLLATAFFAPASVFVIGAQRFHVLTRNLPDQYSIDDLLTLRFLLFVVSGIVFLGYLHTEAEINAEAIALTTAIFVMRNSDGILEMESWRNQLENRIPLFIKIQLLRQVAVIGPVTLAIMISANFLAFLTALIVCACVALMLKQFMANDPRFSKVSARTAPALLRILFPIGSANLMETVMVLAPRLILSQGGQVGAMAAYSLVTQLTSAAGILASARLQQDLPSLKQSLTGRSIVRRNFVIKVATYLFLLGLAALLMFLMMPANLYVSIFGGWVSDHTSLFIYIGPLIFIWYSGGYLQQGLKTIAPASFVIAVTVASTLPMLIYLIAFKSFPALQTALAAIAALGACLIIRLLATAVLLLATKQPD